MKKLLHRALTTTATAGLVVAATATAANATVVAEGWCRTDTIVRVCVEEHGPTRMDYDVLAVENGDVLVGVKVAAYRDVYALGTLQFTCITPVVDGVERNACGSAGLTRVERHVLLSELDVEANAQRVKVIGTVYICEADLTATVAGNGVNGEPILTVCQNGLPTFGS